MHLMSSVSCNWTVCASYTGLLNLLLFPMAFQEFYWLSASLAYKHNVQILEILYTILYMHCKTSVIFTKLWRSHIYIIRINLRIMVLPYVLNYKLVIINTSIYKMCTLHVSNLLLIFIMDYIFPISLYSSLSSSYEPITINCCFAIHLKKKKINCKLILCYSFLMIFIFEIVWSMFSKVCVHYTKYFFFFLTS